MFGTNRSLGARALPVGTAILLACVTFSLGACGGGGKPSADEIAQGLSEFRKTCATCHGQNGEGMPRLGKDLHRNEFVQGLDDAELLEFLKVGRPAGHPLNERGVDMPPKGGNPAITEEQLKMIVAYVRSIG